MKVKLKTNRNQWNRKEKQIQKKINETESSLFFLESSLFIGKINKIDKPTAKLIKEKEKDINYQYQERQTITTDSTDLKE